MNPAETKALLQIYRSINAHGLRIHGSTIHRRVRIVLVAEGLIEEDPVYETMRLTPAGRTAAEALDRSLDRL